MFVPSADSEGLLCVRFSGDADVAGPVQSVGMLTPLVPLLGTAKGRELAGGTCMHPLLSPLAAARAAGLCLGSFGKRLLKSIHLRQGMVVSAFNPTTWEAEL